MTLIVMTVVVVTLLIAALAIYLFMIGVVLNRTATNLGDCVQSMRTVVGHTNVIGSGVTRLNKTGGELLGALPLLLDDAEAVAAKLAPSVNTPAAAVASPSTVTAGAASSGAQPNVGYLDLDPAPTPNPAPSKGVGYLDQ